MKSIIKTLNPNDTNPDSGWGFIKNTDSAAAKNFYFSQSDLRGITFSQLRQGMPVEFDLENGPKGPQARNVRATETAAPPPATARPATGASISPARARAPEAPATRTRSTIATLKPNENNPDSGWGFIKNPDPASKQNCFFTQYALKDIKFSELTPGMEVEFEITDGSKGPQARNIRAIGNAPAKPAPAASATRLRGAVKSVKAFDDNKDHGWGFIQDTNAPTTPPTKGYFFTHSDLRDITLSQLTEGMPVEFEAADGPKGPQARNVRAPHCGERDRRHAPKDEEDEELKRLELEQIINERHYVGEESLDDLDDMDTFDDDSDQYEN